MSLRMLSKHNREQEKDQLLYTAGTPTHTVNTLYTHTYTMVLHLNIDDMLLLLLILVIQ